MLVASEDATSGSVMAKHDRTRPCSSGTSHRRCCSSVPYFASTCVHLFAKKRQKFVKTGIFGN